MRETIKGISKDFTFYMVIVAMLVSFFYLTLCFVSWTLISVSLATMLAALRFVSIACLIMAWVTQGKAVEDLSN